MIKIEKPQLGDIIITTDKFCPIDKNKKQIGPFPNLRGIIILQFADIFGIKFEKETEWTHDLGEILLTKTGHFLAKEDFKIIDKYKEKNKEKAEFIKAIKKSYYQKLAKIPSNLKNLELEIKYKKEDIASNKRSIIKYKHQIIDKGKQIDILKKKAEIPFDISIFEKQFDRLKKSSKIKDIKITENYIVITTNDLTYKKTFRIPSDFILGAYKIFIPSNSDISIKAINYKKHFKREYFHPCITITNGICMGEEIRKEIEELRRKNQIDLIIFLLINFIEEPNYNSPYIDDLSFMCAQDITIKPKNIEEWLDISYWHNNEKWDDDLYTKTRNKLTSNN